ncbi:MAG: hypothetical protein AAF531_21285, partial [Actinomycetota bacterium]
NVAALSHIPNDISVAIQEALLALADHAAAGERLKTCYAEMNCTLDLVGIATPPPLLLKNVSNSSVIVQDGGSNSCQAVCNKKITLSSKRCDTTPELALLAYDAKVKGKYSSFRSTLSYMELRNMQEDTGFIGKNPVTGAMQCARSKTIYDAIVCPPGHIKRKKTDVENGCQMAGLPCKTGFTCLCPAPWLLTQEVEQGAAQAPGG